MTNNLKRYHQYILFGRSGRAADVDRLMQSLTVETDLATSKLVDYALSLVESAEGKARLQYYLFEGSQIQRNFAALYFKRREQNALLDEAVAMGKIDLAQAYAK